MRNPVCAVVLAGLLLAASALRAQEVQILMIGGPFHKGEVTAKSGEEWYGLFPEGDKYRLERTKIQITLVRDIILDKENEKTGMQVSCDKPGMPLFLVRGISGLNNRPVDTAWKGKRFFYPGEGDSYYFDGIHTGIRASGEVASPEQPGGLCFRNYALHLSKVREFRRLVFYEKLDPEGTLIPALLWVGDLDNDKKMDMFWDLTGHYYKQQFTLYLSSLVKNGEWLAKAAEFIHTAD